MPAQNSTTRTTKVKVTNSKNKSTEDLIKLEGVTKPFTDKIDSVNELLQKKYTLTNSLPESSDKKLAENEIDNLEIIIEQLKTQKISSEFNFIKQNPSSYISLDVLSFRLKRSEGIIYYDTIQFLFNKLSKPVQNSVAGIQLKVLFARMNNSKVGSLAPDFTVKDVNDIQISLSAFRNKEYVLLDFWASWCAPCRDEIPFLKDIHRLYNDKGFEIIGISQDHNSVLWKNAIAKDSIQIWKHILVKKGSQKINNSILDDYFIYGIPVKVLINKEGKIIGRWRGGGVENKESLEKQLHKIFE